MSGSFKVKIAEFLEYEFWLENLNYFLLCKSGKFTKFEKSEKVDIAKLYKINWIDEIDEIDKNRGKLTNDKNGDIQKLYDIDEINKKWQN